MHGLDLDCSENITLSFIHKYIIIFKLNCLKTDEDLVSSLCLLQGNNMRE